VRLWSSRQGAQGEAGEIEAARQNQFHPEEQQKGDEPQEGMHGEDPPIIIYSFLIL
jgi:hypothetical protein